MLVLNEIVAPLAGTAEVTAMLQSQYDMGNMLIDMGMSGTRCPEERYRVCLMQNMLWSNTGIMDWMEKTYGAITVMDGFGYQDGVIFDDLDNWEKTKMQLAESMLLTPMIHGATGPTEYWLKVIDKMYTDYKVNVSIFMGHVGCKHTWASGKIVTDYIQEKFGIPTLYVDVDAIDPRYKTSRSKYIYSHDRSDYTAVMAQELFILFILESEERIWKRLNLLLLQEKAEQVRLLLQRFLSTCWQSVSPAEFSPLMRIPR